MNRYIFFLGTHSALAATEAWGLLNVSGFHIETVRVHNNILSVESSHDLAPDFLHNLGGTPRIARELARWSQQPTAENILDELAPLPARWTLGINSLGMSLNIKTLGTTLKKLARKRNSRLTFILPSPGARLLNAAQIMTYSLSEPPNADLILWRDEHAWVLLQTLAAQNITAYERRDTARPARDPFVGMLPPKVAQMMLNITRFHVPGAHKPHVILDPFCGLGTVLQEGWLLGCRMIGTDASKTMIKSSGRNMQWLFDHFHPSKHLQPELRVHDIQQPFPADWTNTIDAVVTEPYLGHPLSSPPSGSTINKTFLKL
ncbi:MAG: TRM11 family SAM-dependent methyltransferase, partial [Acidobacteriota bacterium]